MNSLEVLFRLRKERDEAARLVKDLYACLDKVLDVLDANDPKHYKVLLQMQERMTR